MIEKPRKPSADFPLFPHASGQWAKKIGGKFHYFGIWNDAQAALANYQQLVGETPCGAANKITKSNKVARTAKARRPYPDYPLFAHANGQWAKKIRRKLHYFGAVADPDSALQRYLDQKDDLPAGRTPRTSGDGLTLRELLDRFLTSKQRLKSSGDIVQRTFEDYRVVCERMADSLDRTRPVTDFRAEDFEKLRADLAKTRGPTSLANDITRIRSVFKYAYDAALIDQPVRFGKALKKPNKRSIRLARQAKGPRMFERHELLRMLEAASDPLRAMLLLGVNCGFGNHDCGTLLLSAVDMKASWINLPRPKTGTPRRCPLWRETIKALRRAIEGRPDPNNAADKGLVFITSRGNRWARDDDRPISKETTKLLKALKIHRSGLGFYALRHTFETIGGEARDQVAVDHIRGRAREDMAGVYRERIRDERLVAVTEHVRQWIFGGDAKPGCPEVATSGSAKAVRV